MRAADTFMSRRIFGLAARERSQRRASRKDIRKIKFSSRVTERSYAPLLTPGAREGRRDGGAGRGGGSKLDIYARRDFSFPLLSFLCYFHVVTLLFGAQNRYSGLPDRIL